MRPRLRVAGTNTERGLPASGAGSKERQLGWNGGVTGTLLPHHTLIAYQVALELVKLVGRIRIRDAQLRAQARKSAASAALNAAEGAARQSLADKSRAYAIALAECCEACAAVEIAAALGACSPEHLAEVLALGVRLKNLLLHDSHAVPQHHAALRRAPAGP